MKDSKETISGVEFKVRYRSDKTYVVKNTNENEYNVSYTNNSDNAKTFITDQNGLLVPADDINAMAEAMCKMYDNYCQFDNVAIANGCLNKFSPHEIASQLTEIFDEVTK